MDINLVLEQHALWLDTNGEEGSRANLKGRDLEGINLARTNLAQANMKGSNLRDANLEEVNFEGADLEEVNFVRANLKGANFFKANLSKANFFKANLSKANLSETKLEGTVGELVYIKTIFCNPYHPMTYTADVIQFGCQQYKIEDWWSFDDADFVRLGGEAALKRWKDWKPILQQVITVSPALPTGYAEK